MNTTNKEAFVKKEESNESKSINKNICNFLLKNLSKLCKKNS